MKSRCVVTSLFSVAFVVQSAAGDITGHTGRSDSNPPGSGEVDVAVNDVAPPGPGLGVSVLFAETAPWTLQYAFEQSEPPVSVDLFFDENLTQQTWYDFQVDLVGAYFVFVNGSPVPTVNPVGAGVGFTRPVACSSAVRSAGNATLVLHMTAGDALVPGDGATLSFFASGAGNGFSVRVTPLASFADGDGDGLPNACESSGGPVGACCDACAGVCQEATAQADCPTTYVWTEDTSCDDACPSDPMDCDDGLFCTGVESCAGGACMSPGNPCAAPSFCNEELGACVECIADTECDDGEFCNGAEVCGDDGACGAGEVPCDESECDEEADECAGDDSGMLCSFLGDFGRRRLRDRDAFRFYGVKGEQVVITLAAAEGNASNGKVVLRLADRIRRFNWSRMDKSAVPNEIVATLPKTGEYRVFVGEAGHHRRHGAFRGAYCLTLQSSAGAASTLATTQWVED